MTDQVTMSMHQVPPELARVITLTGDRKSYLPILYVDELTMRMKDLRMVNATDTSSDIELVYRPISFGKLRLFLQFYAALSSMHAMGFTEKDTDEVKGIFADTNLVLLLVTFGVSAVHLLFDFLAFKNDVNFWRGKKTMEGNCSRVALLSIVQCKNILAVTFRHLDLNKTNFRNNFVIILNMAFAIY